MDFHVLAKRARVCIGLVTALHLTVVGLVARVHVTVLLPVGAVGETSVTAVKFTLERLLTWRGERGERGIEYTG